MFWEKYMRGACARRVLFRLLDKADVLIVVNPTSYTYEVKCVVIYVNMSLSGLIVWE